MMDALSTPLHNEEIFNLEFCYNFFTKKIIMSRVSYKAICRALPFCS